MYNEIVQPKLHFEFELEDEMVRLPRKLPMHIFQNSHNWERIKTDYIWLIGASLLLVIAPPVCPAPSGQCRLMAAWRACHEHTGKAAGTRTELQ